MAPTVCKCNLGYRILDYMTCCVFCLYLYIQATFKLCSVHNYPCFRSAQRKTFSSRNADEMLLIYNWKRTTVSHWLEWAWFLFWRIPSRDSLRLYSSVGPLSINLPLINHNEVIFWKKTIQYGILWEILKRDFLPNIDQIKLKKHLFVTTIYTINRNAKMNLLLRL